MWQLQCTFVGSRTDIPEEAERWLAIGLLRLTRNGPYNDLAVSLYTIGSALAEAQQHNLPTRSGTVMYDHCAASRVKNKRLSLPALSVSNIIVGVSRPIIGLSSMQLTTLFRSTAWNIRTFSLL